MRGILIFCLYVKAIPFQKLNDINIVHSKIFTAQNNVHIKLCVTGGMKLNNERAYIV